MKNNLRFIYALILIIFLSSCENHPAGTLRQIDEGNSKQIEVFKYYFKDNNRIDWVFVSRFKDEPSVVTTTWSEQSGKTRITRGNVVIFENDSIQVILKK